MTFGICVILTLPAQFRLRNPTYPALVTPREQVTSRLGLRDARLRWSRWSHDLRPR